MSEHESTRFVLHPHAARRMRFRDISALDISQVLEDYETRRLARQLTHLDYRSEIFVGMVRGRRLRVYVMQGSDPPYHDCGMGEAMITYADDIDILYVQLSDTPVAETEVIDDFRFVDRAEDGSVVGAEFIGAKGGIDLRGLPEGERLEALVQVLKFPILV